MTQIQSTLKPIYWACQYQSNILWSGLLDIGQALATPLVLISADDDNAFLAAANGQAGNYLPLPGIGMSLVSGDIYGWAGGLVIVRQSHIRTANDPLTVPALFSVYRVGQTGVLDWVANEAVVIGEHRKYLTIEYVCLQKHTTQVDWTPDKTPALWQVYAAPSNNWAVGVAYKIGDIVIYVPNGFTYKCIQAHTSQAGWTPPIVPALWQLQ